VAILILGGGSDGAGLRRYLVSGEKRGRTKTRDELDKRLVLDGDLNLTTTVIQEMHTAAQDTERFLHLTFSFSEADLNHEILAAINADLKEFFLGGYEPGEVNYYAEAHLAKIKTLADRSGNPKERLDHIHIIIPKHNNLTGKKEDPLGMVSAKHGGKFTTMDYMDAIQEHINHKYGLTSPKDEDRRRVNFESQADILKRIDGFDFNGKNRSWLQTIRDRMIAEKIETPDAFRAMLEKIGDVSTGKEGHADAYLQVRPFGEQKNIRLKDWQFTNEFIKKTTQEKEAFINKERVRKYIESQPGRPTPEATKEILAGWKEHQQAIRFMRSDSKIYKEKYINANDQERKVILAELQAEHYTKAKGKFGYDNNQLTPEAELDKQEAEYQAAIAKAFPNRKLNTSFLRSLDEIQEAMELGDEILDDPEAALEDLTFSQSVITERDLERYLLKNTGDADQYNKAMAAILKLPSLVVRQDAEGNTTFTTKEIRKIEQNLIESVERMAQVGKPQSRKELDSLLARLFNKAKVVIHKFKPQRIEEIEGDSWADIQSMPLIHDIPSIHETENERIAREVAATKKMNVGQSEAYNVLVSDRQIAVVNGAPGTGKSYILQAMREAEERKGNTVYGAILQGKTAEDLERDSGIKSSTMASFLHRLKKGTIKLDKKSVIVIDEAGMVGSNQMAAILQYVEKAGARIRLVGDVKQLSAVEFGSAFKQISDRVDVASLTEIMRQKQEWQRAASEQLSRHKIAEPIQTYHDNGHVHFTEDAEEAKAAVVDKWNTYRQQNPKESLIVLVATNKERRDLNDLMRDEIKKEGGLVDEVDVVTGNGLRRMAVGERVMFTEGDRDLGVKNGTVGTVTAIEDGKLFITTGDGKRVQINADGKGTKDGNKIDYFYACTVHKSQGMTQDHAIVLVSPGMTLETTLVSMTRHKHSLDVVVNKEQFQDVNSLVKGLDKVGRKDFSHDEKQPEWKAARKSDNIISQFKANFAHEKIIEKAAKTSSFVEIRDNLDARQLLDVVARTHGVDLALYGIIKDKNGRDRIECGRRYLAVSDFLTKELHLDYKTEADPLLREVYAAQLQKNYDPLQAGKKEKLIQGHVVDKTMWRQFYENLDKQDVEYKKTSSALSSQHKLLKEKLSAAVKIKIKEVDNSKLSYAEKKTVKKDLRIRVDAELRKLSEAVKKRRGELMRHYKKPLSIQYKEFLKNIISLRKDDRALEEYLRISTDENDHIQLAELLTIEKEMASDKQPQQRIEVNVEAAKPQKTPSPALPNTSPAQSAVEPQANSEQTKAINDEFENAAVDAEVRDHCDHAKILAIRNSSVVVSLGRKKAIIHDVENAQTLEPGEMITIKNKVASLIKNERPKGLTRF
jgi:Ti-type conjugative transfer relaxase TraA